MLFYYGVFPIYGGLEKFAVNLIPYLLRQDQKLSVHLLVESPDFAYKNELLALERVTYSLLPSSHRHPFKFMKGLRRLLTSGKGEPVLMLNVCSFRNLALFHAAKSSRVQTIVVGHLSSTVGGAFSKLLHYAGRLLYRSFCNHVAVDERVAAFMYGNNKGAAVIHNGVNFWEYQYDSPGKETFLSEIPETASSKIRVGIIGRLSDQKNQAFAISLFLDPSVRQRCRLFIVGDDSNSSLVAQLKKDCNDSVTFLGERHEQMRAIYSALDVVLVPAKSEGGLSFVLLEALSAGCKVLFNNDLGHLSIEHPGISYLPLEKGKWISALKTVVPLSEEERATSYEPLAGTEYDLSVSLSKHAAVIQKVFATKL